MPYGFEKLILLMTMTIIVFMKIG